ncbi:MAG TPA: HTTM domain-containing protein [Sandaracinaceae bacterium LLY-WYZ-13_1]|nr:HTTM domain-containing protein [Sandaracinaceae bacterium LLY-WYZ-13_1]
MIARDARLRVIALLLVPGFVGHFIQLASEDVPWAAWARMRYWNTPGWHLLLPMWVPAVIAAGLAIAVIGLAIRRTRPWMWAVVGLYLAHYLTYPYRIRNHMSHMAFEMTMLGGVWLLGRLSGASDWRGRGPAATKVDRWAVTGMGAVLCVTYVFAGLHKINDMFLSFDPDRSSAVEGLTTFWIYGDLGSVPPRWAMAVATYGTVAIELCAPLVAWRVPKLRVPAVLVLFAFHFPHVAVMNVADYPMIASAFYPALFSPGHFRLLLRHARRPNAWNVTGASLGIAAQLWWIPWWGGLTILGIFVMALWGWAGGSMLRMVWHGRRLRALVGRRALT